MRGGMITQILEAGYVKCHQATLRYVLMRHENDGRQYEFNQSWKLVGRPPLLTDSEVGELSERVASNCGQKNGKEEVNKFLLENQKKMGLTPVSGKR